MKILNNTQHSVFNLFLLIVVLHISACSDWFDDDEDDAGTDNSLTSSTTCYAPHLATGIFVPVVELRGPTFGNAFAIANYNANGYPVITYGPRFFEEPKLIQKFIELHECAHLSQLTSDEILANCFALQGMRNLGLTNEQENQIAIWHYSMTNIAPQYGGTGENFWNMTLACAG